MQYFASSWCFCRISVKLPEKHKYKVVLLFSPQTYVCGFCTEIWHEFSACVHSDCFHLSLNLFYFYFLFVCLFFFFLFFQNNLWRELLTFFFRERQTAKRCFRRAFVICSLGDSSALCHTLLSLLFWGNIQNQFWSQ